MLGLGLGAATSFADGARDVFFAAGVEAAERFRIRDSHRLDGGTSNNSAMTLHAWRVSFAFDPLVAEAKRRMRRRRLLVVTLLVLLVGGAIGTALALRGPSGKLPSQAAGSFSNLAFRSPAGWNRVNWTCWIGPLPSMLLFTTARPTPTCRDGSFPPQEQLGANGAALWLEYPAPPLNVQTVDVRLQPSEQIAEGVGVGVERGASVAGDRDRSVR